MNLTFNKYHPRKFIRSISSQIDAVSYADCMEEILELPSNLGQGKITGFSFSNGIGFVVFDCFLNEDWSLDFVNDFPAPLSLNFLTEGELWHAFYHENIRYHLNPLQGSIAACPVDSIQNIILPSNQKILYTILSINRRKYLKKIDCLVDQMPDKLADVFSDVNGEQSFFYQGNYSLSVSACIKKITHHKHKGLVRSTYIEGKVLELLSKQIKQYEDDLNTPNQQLMLRKYDVDKIKMARDILIKNIETPPTIQVLAKKAGINQQKLKTGFKAIFDKTINQYLRDERLEMASILLLQGNSIKDTVHRIGYSNQSHFARKFKEKYGVLPKDYLRSVSVQVSGNQ
ncbi:MAG: AraC family transcriptional regulator [Bacteroidota bacterium]